MAQQFFVEHAHQGLRVKLRYQFTCGMRVLGQRLRNTLKAQIAALLQKAANTDEAEKNEPELDIPAEIERRTARLAAIEAAKTRLEERHRQSDAARGHTPDDARYA